MTIPAVIFGWLSTLEDEELGNCGGELLENGVSEYWFFAFFCTIIHVGCCVSNWRL